MDDRRLSESFFVFRNPSPLPLSHPAGYDRRARGEPKKERSMKNTPKKEKTSKKDVIAYRKTCKAKGTGLSHYILMDKKAK